VQRGFGSLFVEKAMSQRRFRYPAPGAWIALVATILGLALGATASPAWAQYGSVTLTQFGSNVIFDVILSNGYRFEETADGDQALFFSTTA